MKKLFVFFLAVICIFTATACSSNITDSDTLTTTASTDPVAAVTTTLPDESTPITPTGPQVKITFLANGGKIDGKPSVVIETDKGKPLPASEWPTNVKRDGKIFLGWYNMSTASNVNDKTVFSEDTELYATWETDLGRIPDDEIPTATEKPRVKPHITLIFDDNKPDLQTFYDIIVGEYGLPMCAAIPGSSINNGNLELLKKIQASGGEILSHTQTHIILTRNVAWTTVDREFSQSKKVLTEAGLNVNGIILAGGGGTEDTSLAYRQELQGITAKYYSYSDLYGAKKQFYKPRECFNNWGAGRAKTFDELKVLADRAIRYNEWMVIYAHNLNECPPDTLRMFIEYLLDNGAEFITYKTAYETLFDWDRPVNFN